MKRNLLFFILLLPCLVQGQELYTSSGSSFHNHGTVYINGDVEVNGKMETQGKLLVDSNLHLIGKMMGSGEYFLQGDLKNFGSFHPDSSIFHLEGPAQWTLGDTLTSFYELRAEGTGKKHLDGVNISVLDSLSLSDRILQVHNDTVFLPTGDTGMISRTTGFVMNDRYGKMVRKTVAGKEYWFPLGSDSGGTTRFRPVFVDGQANVTAGLGFHNTDPNSHGFPRGSREEGICFINDLYYHSGWTTDSTDLEVRYRTSDGDFNDIVIWPSTEWKKNGPGGKVPGPGVEEGFRPDGAFALARKNPEGVSISGDTMICGEEQGHYTVSGLDSGYVQWEATNGTITDSSGRPGYADIEHGPSGGLVIAEVIGGAGCSSKGDSLVVEVGGGPVADFSPKDTVVWPGDIVLLTDQSTDADLWTWDDGNGIVTTGQNNGKVTYSDPGDYEVGLLVEDSTGCTDTAWGKVMVKDELLIPNVFSPNGDGKNEVFEIRDGGLSDWSLTVYDRWGNKIYTGKKGDPFWDGKNLSGRECSEGTYLFVFQAPNEEVEKKGNVMLVR